MLCFSLHFGVCFFFLVLLISFISFLPDLCTPLLCFVVLVVACGVRVLYVNCYFLTNLSTRATCVLCLDAAMRLLTNILGLFFGGGAFNMKTKIKIRLNLTSQQSGVSQQQSQLFATAIDNAQQPSSIYERLHGLQSSEALESLLPRLRPRQYSSFAEQWHTM